MKNSIIFNYRTIHLKNPFLGFLTLLIFVLASTATDPLHAQQALSIQGILKKSNGDAVEDGPYKLTFKLFKNAEIGSPVWTEVHDTVEVTSGIYSTILGKIAPLNVAFDTTYYLGVFSGSTEMKPRVQLTSAPYALALIGANNKFPSAGQVIADSIKVTNGLLARAGVPGNNGSNHSGYGFAGNNGQKDSGLFSTPTSGNVSLYVDNSEKLKATADSVVIKSDMRLSKGSNVNYNGLEDWRLVYQDDFTNNVNGWQYYNPSPGEYIGWNNGTAGGDATLVGNATNFAGRYIVPGTVANNNAPFNRRVLKKQYDLTNAGYYNFIKIKFKYYVLDTWDDGQDGDRGLAMIAESATGTQLRVGWTLEEKTWTGYTGDLGNTFSTATNFGGGTNADYTRNAEMTFSKCSTCNNMFWLMFGARLNEDIPNENYGVGMIEIWVK